MRVLISNDDGIHAPGLKILEEIAHTLSNDVWIVAPELDQSASSHSLTLRNPLRIREISDKKFALSGTPSDCVLFAAHYLLKDHKPDLVLSGINYGTNLAEDVTYSGTIAAAMEASLLGIPAIAISQEIKLSEKVKWETPAKHLPDIIKNLIHQELDPSTFLNINIPDLFPETIKGIRITHQGRSQFKDEIQERTDPRGKKYYWIGGVKYGSGDPHSDIEAVKEGYISVSPLTIDLTDYKTADFLRTNQPKEQNKHALFN